ncbi:serine hydrolase domain-containing protein [Elizabethkingia meningoseptica]|uniref:serine hydrolase domain-containing protein n=1 Tax=Elizabethkingia meningoseptica TaxID=238 RepID=UPI0008421041|nr:serine hydrolase domain-containing protein [Elizabethkingia meningoseptica]ODM55377.1 penicillin-binding protein 4 [Elizabethkingia meningoseptica]OHT30584.1 penicillin-binding protein 4 [Elizabethkingia meningoseptica]OPC15614.1 penicillin-binding protein 4 [Elizabethkingia meningoseptica]
MKNTTEILDYYINKTKFNGNIMIADGRKVLYIGLFGETFNPGEKQELNRNSVFELASVSKPFTAFAMLKVLDVYHLSLHTDIRYFLPGFPYKDITLFHLLNHTSGLPDYMELFEKHWDKTKIADNQDVLAMLSKYHPKIYFQPGGQWDYSNTGYVLLAVILEKITGFSFPEVLQKYIFRPLGMENTQVYNRRKHPHHIIPDYAFGVQKNPENNKFMLPDDIEGEEYVYYLDGIQGDGTVNSTLDDLLIWNNAILEQYHIHEKHLDIMFEPTILSRDRKFPYGLGWEIDEQRNNVGKVVYHTGSWPGYFTCNSVYLEKGISIILLSNKPDLEEDTEEKILQTLEDVVFNKEITIPLHY